MTEQNILNFPAQISLEFGLDYLSRVKLTNLALAEQQLAAFLDRLLEQPPESGSCLNCSRPCGRLSASSMKRWPAATTTRWCH